MRLLLGIIIGVIIAPYVPAGLLQDVLSFTVEALRYLANVLQSSI